jgi:putative hydrolase of the HAD superfamily
MRTRAVFFDVDFTLIYPGPTFQGDGYQQFCARHGITVDPCAFDAAVRGASSLLVDQTEGAYDPGIFIAYTRRIIEGMGGTGGALDACAREIYEEWASCHHFSLYDDVPGIFERLVRDGIRIGLISNTHRCLASFQSHFQLEGLVAAAVSSSEHGFMKPHRSIFEAALRQAGVSAPESVMVGDSYLHDVEGAVRLGMRGVLLSRSGAASAPDGVPVISSLAELPHYL